MTDFADPPNKEEILKQLNNLKTPDDTNRFVETHFPGWLILSLPEYSKDYPHLQNNWEKICSLAKCKPQYIVLVSDIKFDDTHIATSVIAEFMTRNGYCVRRAEEFVACQTCERAIPCKNLWALMREKNIPVPKEWSGKCSSC
jgi:hypothetical protein